MRDHPIVKLFEELDAKILERTELIRGMVLALLARKHLFVLGPPGTAKSLIAELFCKASKLSYFEWLMDKSTKPEDLFGPIKISKLKEDAYERKTEGTVVDAEVVFLDEIWKASGFILNTLLRLLDESRRFYNNRKTFRAPLMSLFAASNELPENGSLGALWDRFMLRFYVNNITEASNFKELLGITSIRLQSGVAKDDLLAAQAAVDAVSISDAVADKIVELWSELRSEGFVVSDRRWRESMQLLKAEAWLNGRDEVAVEDLRILSHCFWNKPEERKALNRTVLKVFSVDSAKAIELLDTAQEVADNALKIGNSDAGVEANDKLKQVFRELGQLSSSPHVDEVVHKVKALQSEVARRCLGMNL